MLSPLAAPFHPTISMPFSMYEPSEFVIYSDGIPVLVSTDADNKAVLQGISDEAIDEVFPPTLDEQAELETVDEFNEILAELSVLEESEEEARRTFCHIKKRWEARREEGLIGKPKPMKALDGHKQQRKNSHCESRSTDVELRSTKKLSRSDQLPVKHIKEERKHFATPKNVRGFHNSKPIHQPRKN